MVSKHKRHFHNRHVHPNAGAVNLVEVAYERAKIDARWWLVRVELRQRDREEEGQLAPVPNMQRETMHRVNEVALQTPSTHDNNIPLVFGVDDDHGQLPFLHLVLTHCNRVDLITHLG